MKRSKFSLPVQKWGTIKSKYQPESNVVSPDEFTVGSHDFITNNSGAIEKRPTDVQYNVSPLSAPGKDQFEAIFTNGTHHLLLMDNGTLKYTSGDTIVNIVASGYTATGSMEYAMYQNRVYFDNGIDAAGVYDLTASYGGVSYTPPQVKNMGAQAPVATATFNADSAGGSVPVGGHTYKITFLYYGFEESNGGPASALHTVSSPNQTVNLKTIPTGGYGVTARKIYRDNNDGNYVLVGTISDNTTTTFVESLSAGTTPIPVSNNLPPVFSYIVLNLSRLWVAGVSGTPTTIYWSNPGLPDIFDPNSFVLCNPKDPIQGLVVYQGTVYVFNRHSFGQILGNTTDTFYYQEFPGSVGCTDNRSIQVRTINGVPTLIWLSDRGLYSFNGSSAEYISDAIEDEVNLNIQQVNFVTGSNSQSTQADFSPAIPYPSLSPAIDINTNPGEITTIKPTKTFQSDADWNGGSLLQNAQTLDGLNSLKTIPYYGPSWSSGTLGGQAYINNNFLRLPIYPSTFSGESTLDTATYIGDDSFPIDSFSGWAERIYIPRNSTMTNMTFRIINKVSNTTETGSIVATIWIDSLGTVGPVMASSSPTGVSVGPSGPQTLSPLAGAPGTAVNVTISLPVSLPSGYYWIGFTSSNRKIGSVVNNQYTFFNTNGHQYYKRYNVTTGYWVAAGYGVALDMAYTVVQTPVSSAGSWVSPAYDSKSVSMTNAFITINATLGSGLSASVILDAADDSAFSTNLISHTFVLVGNLFLGSSGLAARRYWRISIILAAADDRFTPSIDLPLLAFPNVATWISNGIDCTTDIVSYNPLSTIQNIPAFTSVAFTVATSADNITYSAYGPIGSAVVQRYIKVKAVLTSTLYSESSPSVTLINTSWNLTATFISSIINAGQVPSGWGLFQAISATNGGGLTLYMRSAASAGAIPAATFYAVSNGNFPDSNILPRQYTQWKAVFNSAPNTLPTIDSVTINWFLGNNQSPIRVASLFFNKTYYLAAAESGQTTNNVVIVWDFEGNWRLFRGLSIVSLGLFFNQPFYLDGVRPNVYQWLIPATGTGESIAMDVRTKAFDASDHEHLKNPRSLRVMGLNTGTTIHAYFSVDRGNTWIEMLNSSGVVGYTTTTDGSKFYEYFVPNYELGQTVAGVTVMFRITSMDAFPCKILSIDPEITVRSGKYLGRAL